jgi:hypothetical protein
VKRVAKGDDVLFVSRESLKGRTGRVLDVRENTFGRRWLFVQLDPTALRATTWCRDSDVVRQRAEDSYSVVPAR